MCRLNFEIPNYQVSGLRVKGLAVDVADKNYNAYDSLLSFQFQLNFYLNLIFYLIFSSISSIVIATSVILLNPTATAVDFKDAVAFDMIRLITVC